jgi:uncharacterized membrane protein
MQEEIIKYLTVYLVSAVKFILGPTFGIAFGFNVFITATISILGTMTTVYVLTYFGEDIRKLSLRIFKPKEKKVFSSRKRQFVKIWKKYGIIGIAFLTPILLTPIGGTLVANALGCKKQEIFKYMWISVIFWSYTITWAFKFAKDVLFFV